jgi:hypothetical protein
MSELVCLECGKEMEYDWAPCPHCGWKAPGPWEEPDGEYGEAAPAPRALLAKPRSWIRTTAWVLLAAGLAAALWFFRP